MLTAEQVELKEAVFFETSSAVIGETRSLDDHPIESTLKKNRRVDLFIVEQDPEVVPAE